MEVKMGNICPANTNSTSMSPRTPNKLIIEPNYQVRCDYRTTQALSKPPILEPDKLVDKRNGRDLSNDLRSSTFYCKNLKN